MAKVVNKRTVTVVLSLIFAAIAVVAPFLSILIAGACTPAQYSDTFYGELAPMYKKLRETEGKKVVVLGNSSVAFGVDSSLTGRLLKEGGLDYNVCNFGLYGALGTKMMCELALNCVKEGDIVVFTPELYPQSLSAYFSTEEAWYAIDSDMGMFYGFSSETKNSLVGGYFKYVSKKLTLFNSGTPARGSGVYAKSSFDANCDLKNFPRPRNVMEGGVDTNNLITFESSLLTENFFTFINGFAEDVQSRGGQIYYSLAPMNAEAISFSQLEKSQSFYDNLADGLNFKIISDLNDCIYEKEWFYDSNYHLNESGMAVRSVRLVNDIKTELGNSTKTQYALPEKPIIPDGTAEGEGDNSDADMFEYRLDGSYYTVVGLTEQGKRATELTIPYQVDGVYIKAFLPLVFFDNKVIKKITVQENIHTLSNGSFFGCDNLENIVLKHSEPADISVGYELLSGTRGCKILVPKDSLTGFENNYFWGRYAKQLQGY